MSEKILIVDDEAEITDLIEMYLHNENYIVYKAYTAQKALEYINAEEFDLAILDVMLPGIDGFQLCKKIRETYTYPIIMLTARDGEIDTITGLTMGADDYVTKEYSNYLPDDGKRKKPSFDRHYTCLFIAAAALNKSRPPFFMPS